MSVSKKITRQCSFLALTILPFACGCSQTASQTTDHSATIAQTQSNLSVPGTAAHFVSLSSRKSLPAQTKHERALLPGLHIKIWSLPREERSEFDGVTSIAFSPDGRSLVSGGRDGHIRLWDSRTGRLRRIWQAGLGTVSGLAFSRNGRLLVDHISPGLFYKPNHFNKAQVWDMKTYRLRWSCHANGTTDGVALSPNGQWLAVGNAVTYHFLKCYHVPHGSKGGGVQIWDIQTHRIVRQLQVENSPYASAPPSWSFYPAGQVDHLRFSPDGRTLAGVALFGGGCGDLQTLQTWNVLSSQLTDFPAMLNEQASDDDGSEGVDTVAFSHQRHLFAAVVYDSVHTWNAKTGKTIKNLTHDTGWSLYTLGFSPNGRFEAEGKEAMIDIRDTSTGRLVRRIPTRGRKIQNVAFSPDSHTLSSGSGNGWLEIWHIQ